jgi:hypothetical protein
MNLTELLRDSRETILADALRRLTRAHLPHYAASEESQNQSRLTALYDLASACVEARNLAPMVDHARAVARERHRAGFGLEEVHAAFNVLEEEIWRSVTARLQPSQFPEALGLASTVLGAGKQALAVEWVGLASQSREMRTLDLSALFRGTA